MECGILDGKGRQQRENVFGVSWWRSIGNFRCYFVLFNKPELFQTEKFKLKYQFKLYISLQTGTQCWQNDKTGELSGSVEWLWVCWVPEGGGPGSRAGPDARGVKYHTGEQSFNRDKTGPSCKAVDFSSFSSPSKLWEAFSSFIFYLFFTINLFILFLATLGLCCCVWTFSSRGEWGLLFVGVRRLLIAVASLVVEQGL